MTKIKTIVGLLVALERQEHPLALGRLHRLRPHLRLPQKLIRVNNATRNRERHHIGQIHTAPRSLRLRLRHLPRLLVQQRTRSTHTRRRRRRMLGLPLQTLPRRKPIRT